MRDDIAHVAREYAEAVYSRARVPIEPPGFVPNWADQPFRYKTYPEAARIPLPVDVPDRLGGIDGLPDVSALLRLSYGLLSRRLDVTGNNDEHARSSYVGAVWGRGTASGGGLYPLEIYWVAGPSRHLLPGVYHYAPAHHALERLAVGDLTDRVRCATQHHPAALSTDQFLAVSVRLWRNAFKYQNFAYQVVTQDVGALLGSWQALAGGLPALLWFADEAMNGLLGLRTRDESVMAVVPLPFGAPAGSAPRHDAPLTQVVTPAAAERSRTVVRFAMLDAVHESTLITDEPRPGPAANQPAGVAEPTGTISLPAPASPDLGSARWPRERHSSFGRFTARHSLSGEDLATLLAALAATRDFPTDLKPAEGQHHLTRLLVFANHVEELPAGCYAYNSAEHRLSAVGAPRPVAAFLQQSYSLLNYDLGQVAAVVAIAGRPASVFARFGNRGLRVLNAEAGAVAQVGYLTAAALGLGCGAVLGFDNRAMNEVLELSGTDERTLLFLLFGAERAGLAAVGSVLVPGPVSPRSEPHTAGCTS